MENIITEENSYYGKKSISSISRYKECLDKFSENFSKEIALKTDTTIFLDTNILLRYYSISFLAREKLFEFLVKNQKRIIITTQVQIEFLRNREDIIQRFFEQVTSKIPKDFNTDIVNKMKCFLDQYKVVLKDYSFVEPGIEKYQGELEDLLKRLNSEVELKKKDHNDLIVKDKLLDFLSSCIQCDELTIDELMIVKKHFDLLAKNVTSEKVESIIKKPDGAFPGLGDIKEKPEDPYGDYVIFHEIMKYMITQKRDAIFLTFDNSKGDWMNKNKSPYTHYIQNTYNNTDKILYIIDAERALEELLNIDINSLVSVDIENYQSLITTDSLMKLTISSPAFKDAAIRPFNENFIKELSINGYTSIYEVERDIKKAEKRILKYREINLSLTNIGIIRFGLSIVNPNYRTKIQENGEEMQYGSKLIDILNKFSVLEE